MKFDALDAFGLKPQYSALDDVTKSVVARKPVKACLDPPQIFQALVTAGEYKANLSWWRIFSLGALAGIYLSFGGSLYYFGASQAPSLQYSDPGLDNLLRGLFGIPMGLALILICGAELFTANCMYLPAAYLEGKCTVRQVLKNLFWSFWGNLAGSLFIMYLMDETHLMSHATGPSNSINAATPRAIAYAKTHKSWGATVVSAFLANYMVNLGVLQATASQDIISKLFAVLLPVGTFVTIGLDHLIANMFLITFGMRVGADVSTGRYIWHSVIPVLIGNMISPAFFIAGSYSFIYGTTGERLENWLYKILHKGRLPSESGNDRARDDTAHGASLTTGRKGDVQGEAKSRRDAEVQGIFNQSAGVPV